MGTAFTFGETTFTFGETTFTFGETTFTFGEITFTFGETQIFGFLEFLFCRWGGFGTLWVGGPVGSLPNMIGAQDKGSSLRNGSQPRSPCKSESSRPSGLSLQERPHELQKDISGPQA